MSKETTSTTKDLWTPDASHARGNTPVANYKVEGTYAFVSEDLVESRMVINPFEKLVTEEFHPSPTNPESDNQTAESATDATSAATSTSESTKAKSTETKSTINEAITPQAPFAKTVEEQTDFADKLRNRVSSALGTAAARFDQYQRQRKEGRIKNFLSAAAKKLFEFSDKSSADESSESQVASIPSEREQKDGRLSRIRSKLANLAIIKWFNNKNEKYNEAIDDEKDGYFKRVGNRIRKPELTKRGLGKAAVAGAVVSGAVLTGTLMYSDYVDRRDYNYAGVTYGIEQHNNINKTVLVMGGNYENRPSPDLVDKALEQGVNIEGVDWIAQMGPIAGTVDSRISLNDGASTLQQRMSKLAEYGQDTQVISYSWGTVATAEAYHRIKHSDPELYNKLQPPVLYGSPFGNGAFEGPFGKLAMGVLGVNPDIAKSLPKGTTFIYSERDPYATTGPNSLPLSALFNIAMMQKGSHGIQEGNDFVTIEDRDGNFHKIHRFDAAAALGVTGAGNEELNIAINKLFPMNNDPNSTEKPRADAIGAVFYGAKALDTMVDPTGNFDLFQKVQAQVPEQWMKLLDNSVNGINDATLAVMEAANNPTPENVQRAFNAVISTIGMVNGDLKAALERDMGADIKNGGINVAAQLISEHFGLDYNTVHQQLSTVVNHIEQQAKVIAAQAKAQAQVNAQTRPTTIHSNDTTQVVTLPRQNAPHVPINLNTPPRTSTTSSNNGGSTINWPTPPRNTEPRVPLATVSTPPEASLSQPQNVPVQRTVEAPQQLPLAPAPIAPAEVHAAPTPVAPVEAAPAQPPAPQAPAAPAERRSIFDIFRGGSSARNAPAPSAPAPAAPVESVPQLPVGSSTDPDLAAAS